MGVLGWELRVTDYGGLAMSDAYSMFVADEVPGCGVPYGPGPYWFADATAPPAWSWRPTLTLTGPLGQSLAGIVVVINLVGATCLMRQGTTDQYGRIQFDIPYPHATGWFALGGMARLATTELARLGVTVGSPIPRINVAPIPFPRIVHQPTCPLPGVPAGSPAPAFPGNLLCWLTGR